MTSPCRGSGDADSLAIRTSALGRELGYRLPGQEEDLARAVRAAFGLVPWG